MLTTLEILTPEALPFPVSEKLPVDSAVNALVILTPVAPPPAIAILLAEFNWAKP